MCTMAHGTYMSQIFIYFFLHVNFRKTNVFPLTFNHSFRTYNIFTIIFTVWL